MPSRAPIAVLLASAIALLAPAAASAASFTVNAFGDHAPDGCDPSPGECILRDAIAAAEAASGADTITVPAGAYSVSGALVITSAVTISGPATDAPTATVDAAYSDRVLDVGGGPVTLAHLRIVRGQSNDVTGGSGLLQRSGTVILDHDVFDSHSNNLSGGALTQLGGTLSMSDTEVSGSHAYRGGGLFVAGGIANVDRTLWLADDGTTGGGGAIYNNGGTLNVTNSTFAANFANSAHGGAVYAASSTTLKNVTFEANAASGNSGGGSSLWSDVTVTTANVVFGNPGAQVNCGGVAPGDLGGSVDTGTSCGLAAGASGRTVLLGPLAANGGAARSLLPWSGSAGLGAGADAQCTTTDQRGAERGHPCDAGALEGSAGAPAPPPLLAGGSQLAATRTTADLGATIDRQGLATTYTLDYGPTSAYGTTTLQSSVEFGAGFGAQPVTASLAGLEPGTTYHYRFVTTSAGGTAAGPDRTFTTVGPPRVATQPASSVGTAGATLNGTVDPSGDDTSYRFEYGRTNAYGASTPVTGAGAGFVAQAVSAVVSGLEAGTGYHFRVVASNEFGETAGADETFTTAVAAAPAQATPTPTPTPVPTPTPTPGKTVVVRPISGTVLVRRPGSRDFVALDAAQGIPLGSIVDTRHGVVELTAKPGQTARFSDGLFKVTQTRGIIDLTLTEPLAPCGKAAAAASKPKTRKLWGDGSGSFRTRGQYSAATVRGTRWLVQDTCAGTLTRVAKGVVSVRDNVRRKTIVLRAGKRYLARPRR
jgi:hypothetical protein